VGELTSKLLEFDGNILAHGTEIKVGGADLFDIRLRGVARVVTPRCDVNTCSTKPSSRKHVVSDPRVRQTGKNNWKNKQDSCGVDKVILVLFVIDTHWEI
jgi:hypothetical protein